MVRVHCDTVEYIRDYYNYPFSCGKTIEYTSIKELIGSLEKNDIAVVKNVSDLGRNNREVLESLYYINMIQAGLCVVLDQTISTAKFVIASYVSQKNSQEASFIFDPVDDKAIYKLTIDADKMKQVNPFFNRLSSLMVDRQELKMKENFGAFYWGYQLGKKTNSDILEVMDSIESFEKLSKDYENSIEYFIALKKVANEIIIVPKTDFGDYTYVINLLRERKDIGLVNKTLEKIQQHYGIGLVDTWRILHTVIVSSEYKSIIESDNGFAKSQIVYDMEEKISSMLKNPTSFLKDHDDAIVFSRS